MTACAELNGVTAAAALFVLPESMRLRQTCTPAAYLTNCRHFPILSAATRSRRYQEDVMRKAYLITAILLLSAVWVVAQTGSSTSPSSQTPSSSSSSPSTQSTSPSSGYPQSSSPSSSSPSSQTPDTSSTTTTTQTTQTSSSSSDTNAQTIEGCLAGSAGNFTLTDQSGKSYQLAGDTSKLSDHVGHQVQITGSEAAGSSSASSPSSSSSTSPSSSASSSTGAGASGAGASSGQSTFNVKKVKMISASCPSGASK